MHVEIVKNSYEKTAARHNSVADHHFDRTSQGMCTSRLIVFVDGQLAQPCMSFLALALRPSRPNVV
eukprot:2831976-Pleurochrysis_carterae.AAC.1